MHGMKRTFAQLVVLYGSEARSGSSMSERSPFEFETVPIWSSPFAHAKFETLQRCESPIFLISGILSTRSNAETGWSCDYRLL